MTGDHLSVDALGLFGKELDVGGPIGDLALGLGQRLALFGGQDNAQIILIGHHQIEPFSQDAGAFLAGPACPFLLRGVRLVDGLAKLLARKVGHLGDDITACGVKDVEGSVVPLHPLPGEVSGLDKKGRVLEQ